MLAIVIPYYKHDFFEATLQSLASQTNKHFHVYIGDDASITSPTILLERFQGQFSYSYYRFQTNLGSTSLVKQWNRCLDLVKNETWLQILGDDDTISSNLVQSFYDHLEAVENENCSVIRFASQVIDEYGNTISNVYKHPKIENATDFLIRKFNGGTRSSLSEYFFKKEKVDIIQFKDFPLAWHSDLLAVFEFAEFKTIYTINEELVYFRLSGKNITSRNDDLGLKNRATFLFYSYLLQVYGKRFPDELIQLIFDRLEKTHLDNKKYLKNWFVLFEFYVQFFQMNRFLGLILKIKKSIR